MNIKASSSSNSLATTSATSTSSSSKSLSSDRPKTTEEHPPKITAVPTSSSPRTFLGELVYDLGKKSAVPLNKFLSTASGATNTVADFTVQTGKAVFKAGDEITEALTPPSNINPKQAAKADKILKEALKR
ncbi:MAG: hypothetical protein K2W99_08330 [Chthoniobacterales bacterium]|nr:hypothetical protein [Chthoniobacterales bacterium]